LIADQNRCGAPFALNAPDPNRHNESVDLRLSLMRVHFYWYSFVSSRDPELRAAERQKRFIFRSLAQQIERRPAISTSNCFTGFLTMRYGCWDFFFLFLRLLRLDSRSIRRIFIHHTIGDLNWVLAFAWISARLFDELAPPLVLMYQYATSLRLGLSIIPPSRFPTSSSIVA